MAEMKITVCDECKNPSRPTRHFAIGMEGKTVELDLCAQHRGPIEKILIAVTGDPSIAMLDIDGAGGRAVSGARRISTRGPRLTSIDDIEKSKRRSKGK